MDNQANTAQELSLNEDTLRSLLESEVMLIGGGEVQANGY